MIFDDKTTIRSSILLSSMRRLRPRLHPHIIYRGICNILMPFLEVKDLHASIDEKEILSGFSLNIDKAEVHWDIPDMQLNQAIFLWTEKAY